MGQRDATSFPLSKCRSDRRDLQLEGNTDGGLDVDRQDVAVQIAIQVAVDTKQACCIIVAVIVAVKTAVEVKTADGESTTRDRIEVRREQFDRLTKDVVH